LEDLEHKSAQTIVILYELVTEGKNTKIQRRLGGQVGIRQGSQDLSRFNLYVCTLIPPSSSPYRSCIFFLVSSFKVMVESQVFAFVKCVLVFIVYRALVVFIALVFIAIVIVIESTFVVILMILEWVVEED
jgi:hypothetical protein